MWSSSALLGIYPDKTVIQKNTYTSMFIAALFTIAKTWQAKCPSRRMDKDVVHIYNRKLFCHEKWKSLSRVRLFATPWTTESRNSPGQSTGVGNLSLLQRIFPTQGSNPGLPHCRCVLYHLSHKGSPRILEWIDLSLLQHILSNRRLLHCRQILYRAMREAH